MVEWLNIQESSLSLISIPQRGPLEANTVNHCIQTGYCLNHVSMSASTCIAYFENKIRKKCLTHTH